MEKKIVRLEEKAGNIITNVSTMPSSRRRAIRRWVRWKDKDVIINNRRRGKSSIVGSVSIS